MLLPLTSAARALVLGLVMVGWPVAHAVPDDADVTRLARAIADRRIVLLGEVHDNPAHHALRLRALRLLVAGGARPALAFEQFDRDRQPALDAARREQPRDADHLIAKARRPGDGWDWEHYRPFIQLALEHDLPIVAANLSRTDATNVVADGFEAVFDAEAQRRLGLDEIPAPMLEAHRRAIDAGHCGMLPANLLTPFARAQIARDIVLAARIRPWAERGVVLLAGNGHLRNDIGVPRWLSDGERRASISIAVLEQASPPESDAQRTFDATFVTAPIDRPDPCDALRQRTSGADRTTGTGRPLPDPANVTDPDPAKPLRPVTADAAPAAPR